MPWEMMHTEIETGGVFPVAGDLVPSMESTSMRDAKAHCNAILDQVPCSRDPQCLWHSYNKTCQPWSYLMEPAFAANLAHVDPVRVQGALELARSMSNFHTLIGDNPSPESIFVAMQWQQMFEMKRLSEEVPEGAAAPPETPEHMTARTRATAKMEYYNMQVLHLREHLSRIGDAGLWITQNAWTFESRTIAPGWDGNFSADHPPPYETRNRTVYPGDIVWGGKKLGVLGAVHFEVYIGKFPTHDDPGDVVPWGVGLGKAGADNMGAFELEPFVLQGEMWGSVGAGSITENFAGYGDVDTIDVLEIARNEDRMPRLTSVKLAVSCIGLWNYKMSNPSRWKIPLAPQEGAFNCQQYAMYIQTGDWFSPGLEIIRERTLSMMTSHLGDAIRTMKQFGASRLMTSGVAGTRRKEMDANRFEILARDRTIETSERRRVWPVGNPATTDEQCHVLKANAICFGKMVNLRIAAIARVDMLKKLIQNNRSYRTRTTTYNLKFYQDELDDAIRLGQGADDIKRLTDRLEEERKLAAAENKYLAIMLAEQANVDRQVGSWGMTDNISRKKALLKLRRIVNGTLEIDAIEDGDLKRMLMTERDKMVMVECGGDSYCRDIHELRSILTRQNVKFAYDPVSLREMSPQAVRDIMTSPPELRPRIAAIAAAAAERAGAHVAPAGSRSFMDRIRARISPY